MTSYTTTCEAPKANRLSRSTTEPQTYRLGEPTASGRSRIDGNGASVSIGRIYRPNPELARAQEGDSLQFTLPNGELLTADIISSERTRYGNQLLKATQGEADCSTEECHQTVQKEVRGDVRVQVAVL